MNTPAPYILPLADCRDPAAVGGKAINLSRLINAGFPVPGGFAITTTAYRAAEGAAELPSDVRDAILAAYRVWARRWSRSAPRRPRRTSPKHRWPASVRPFSTSRGSRKSSMRYASAGRVSTRSGCAPISAARDRPGTGGDGRGCAEALVPADVAGVLFTANPRPGALGEMLIESSWGLGEAVVSGLVQPDTLVLDRATGAATSIRTSDKKVWIPAGSQSGRKANPRRTS